MPAAVFSRHVLCVALPYVGILLIGISLVAFESDFLYRVQEQSLFLHTTLFLRQCLVVSGGFLSWLGAYFTQFFFYPALGVAILSFFWTLLIGLLLITFRIPLRWGVLTLIPVVLLLLTDIDLGYWIFYLKLRGHFFVATLGVLVTVGFTWCYRRMAAVNSMLSIVFLAFSVAVGYPLFGFYALLAAVLMAILSWRLESLSRTMAVLTVIVALFSIALFPQLYYHTLYHETNLVNVYWTALPAYYVNGQHYSAYLIPYVLLFATLMVMAACYKTRCQVVERVIGVFWPSISVFGLLAIVTCFFWYKDGNFHRELRMSRSIESQDWERVIEIASESDAEPTRAICMMRNLALFRLGRQGGEMYHYPNGNARPAAPFPVRIVQTEGKMLYFQYGILNFCYRWCIEDGVEYGWSVTGLKYLIKCSLLNNELSAAQKYISILKKTSYHRQWCGKYEGYVRNLRLVVNDPEIMPILPMLKNDDDYLTSDNGDIERFLMEHFASAESRSPVYQEQVLLAAMQLRNAQLFWLRFYQYTELHLGEQAPLHYQEAACLFGNLFSEVNVSQMPFDPQVSARCREFLSVINSYKGQDVQSLAPQLYDRFHDTYFYDYFFHQSQ